MTGLYASARPQAETMNQRRPRRVRKNCSTPVVIIGSCSGAVETRMPPPS
jgi:hypothetical protein